MCHQTVSLVARHLEEAGIPTVIVGSARDIVEQAAVSRFLFSDFPLGNPCGPPDEPDTQRAIVAMGLDLLALAFAPQTTVQTPFAWANDDWKINFMYVDPTKADEYLAVGEARKAKQAAAKTRT